jgi:Fe-S oxidoreductase
VAPPASTTLRSRRPARLGARKAANLIATDADAVAAANPGRALQIAAHVGDSDGTPIYLSPDHPTGRAIRGRSLPSLGKVDHSGVAFGISP